MKFFPEAARRIRASGDLLALAILVLISPRAVKQALKRVNGGA